LNGDARVVDENVDRAELARDLVHRGAQGRALRDVERRRDHRNVVLLDLLEHDAILFLVAREDRDRCARLRQPQRDAAADSAIATGDHRDLAL
jgi:hypothetical protein